MRKYFLPVAFACCLCAPGFAAERQQTDAVLLLDTSASMLTSDPQNQRVEAIRGFMALLDELDRLAVLTFGEQVQRVSDFVTMTPEARQRLEARVISQLTTHAAYTNLLGALEQGLDQLQGHRPDAQVMVVLFTDGRMDMGDSRTNERMTQDLINRVLPRYRNGKVRIYGVAFSDGSDRGLLDAIAKNTGGFTSIAQSPKDVWKAFGHLFEIIKKPDRLPVTNGRFTIDHSVREIRVLSGADGAAPLSLHSPSGRNAVNPAADKGNPVMTIRNPEVGEWTIDNATGKDTVVAASSIRLKTDLPDYVAASRLPLALKAWVEEENQTGGEAIRPINISLVLSGGREAASRRVIPLQSRDGQGVFSGQLPVLATGTYSLEFEAVGKAYRRRKQLTLTVVPDPSPSPSASPQSAAETPKPPSPRPAVESPSPEPNGLFRVEDEAGWKSLKIVLWSNLIVCAAIGAAVLWSRKR